MEPKTLLPSTYHSGKTLHIFYDNRQVLGEIKQRAYPCAVPTDMKIDPFTANYHDNIVYNGDENPQRFLYNTEYLYQKIMYAVQLCKPRGDFERLTNFLEDNLERSFTAYLLI